MTITEILVHVDDSERSRARISAAVELARHHDAHLTAFYTYPVDRVLLYGELQLPAAVIADADAKAQAALEKAERTVQELTGNVGVPVEWCSERGDTATLLIDKARFTDLLVIGKAEEGILSAATSWQNRVLLGAVRPVLVIPHTGVKGAIGERVLVAWKESNEAARAVQDALPLLKRADLVQVMAVNPDQHEGDIPTATLCRYLARHGVNVEASSAIASDLQVSELLLSHIADHSIDLLVMGAYSHARLRQIIFGGVTRGILQSMTVPVLMSH